MRRLVLNLRSPTGYFAEFVGLRASAPTYIRLAGYQVIFREIRLSEHSLYHSVTNPPARSHEKTKTSSYIRR